MTSHEVKKRRARTEQRFADPEFFSDVCESIVNGGSLLQICNRSKLLYSRAINLIYIDENRKSLYEGALKARGDWAVERVLDELRLIGLADIRDAFDADGALKPLKKMPEAVARAISSVEVFEEFQGRGGEREHIGDTKKIRFLDKTKALELLGKNLKMFVEQVEHSGTLNIADAMRKAQARLDRSKATETPE